MLKKYMRAAVAEAAAGMKRGDGGPFGACLVKNGKVLALSHNTVLRNQDPTCHAEMNAIRSAAKKIKSFELSGSEIYSTTEPCPMCFAAIHWAKISVVYFGTAIQDVKARGFNELTVSNDRLKRLGRSAVKIKPNICRQECLRLLERWDDLPVRRTY